MEVPPASSAERVAGGPAPVRVVDPSSTGPLFGGSATPHRRGRKPVEGAGPAEDVDGGANAVFDADPHWVPDAGAGDEQVDDVVDRTVEVERLWLDETSWVDVARGWVRDPGDLFAALRQGLPWQQGRLWRYERWVEEPRLGASWSPARAAPHPALLPLHRAIRAQCGKPFGGAGLALYRDERDGVAFHRDREMRYLDDTVIAIVTLGARRPWHLRPRGHRHADDPAKGATHDVRPGPGDLLVMGGRCQADWEHSVPQERRALGPRMSLQWRWTSKTGRPVEGPGYRAPRRFGR